jgi:putative ABC transport system permease protein
VTMLRRMLLRDLRARASQFAALTLTVLLGVALFGASFDAYRNLIASYNGLYDRLAMADMVVSGGPSADIASALGELNGVVATATRTVGETAAEFGSDRQLVRMVGLPDGGEPAVNKTLVLSGSNLTPGRDDQVLVEQHLAGSRSVSPGDRLRLLTATGWTSVEVAGVVASPEYLWPARSRQEPIVPFDQWGVLFGSEALVAALPPAALHTEAMAIFATDAAPDLGVRAESVALEHGAVSVQPLSEQPSESTLHEDVSGFGEMAVAFPIMFLLAGALGMAVLLGRMITTQRAQIGLLRADGVPRRVVQTHYMAFGLLIGVAGAVPGALLGGLAAASISRLYTAMISVPITVIEVRPTTIVVGVLLGVLSAAMAAYLPARRAARVPPAEAMRGDVPVGRGRISLAERLVPPLRRLPVRWLAAIRGLGRNPRRTISTITGVALAATLILISWGMIDTVQILLDQQFVRDQHQDASVVLAKPAPASTLAESLRVTGVAAVEPQLDSPVAIVHGDARYATRLVGLQPDTTMHSFFDASGHRLAVPTGDRVLLGAALADLLSVRVGDDVGLDLGAGRTGRAEVAGFTTEPLGSFAYASLGTVAGFVAADRIDPMVSTALVRYEPGANARDVGKRLQSLPEVAAVIDSRAVYAIAQSMMGLFYAFVGVMLVLGATMAFVLVFTTMTANVSERSVELAALRVLGMPRAAVSRMVTFENLLLIAVGLVPGLVLGYLAAAAAMASFSSDLFRFDLQVRPTTFVVTALAILAVGLLSQWPALRSVGRIDLGKAVRERAS